MVEEVVAQTWPEQNAVFGWWEKHRGELANMVTEYRVKEQQAFARRVKELEDRLAYFERVLGDIAKMEGCTDRIKSICIEVLGHLWRGASSG